MKGLARAALIATVAVLTLAGCGRADLDANGTPVGLEKEMRAWLEENIPTTWEPTGPVETTRGHIIDDFGDDTGRTETTVSVSYADLTEEEFKEVDARPNLAVQCETDGLVQEGHIKLCYVGEILHIGDRDRAVHVDGSWSMFEDGRTETTFYLVNQPG